jgi:hypothetical protein
MKLYPILGLLVMLTCFVPVAQAEEGGGGGSDGGSNAPNAEAQAAQPESDPFATAPVGQDRSLCDECFDKDGNHKRITR